jgi:hypothetical protein
LLPLSHQLRGSQDGHKARTSESLGSIQIFCKTEEAQLFENYLCCCRFATKVWVLSNGRRRSDNQHAAVD